MITGAFGIKLPENYRFKLTNKNEREEVLWLISEGVFKSIKEYEDIMTKDLLTPLKKRKPL